MSIQKIYNALIFLVLIGFSISYVAKSKEYEALETKVVELQHELYIVESRPDWYESAYKKCTEFTMREDFTKLCIITELEK